MSEVSATESGSNTEAGTRLQNFLDRAGLRGFPWKTAIILYTISWGWLFIVRDSYWADDWIFFPKHANHDWTIQGQAPWIPIGENILFEFFGPMGFRVLTFIFFFSAGIFFYGILNSLKKFPTLDSGILALLFLLMPFNTARVAMMVFHYTAGNFLFFLAWYLVVCSNLRWSRFLAALAFFLSFQMHSLLFLYALPLINMWLNSRHSLFNNFRLWLGRNSIFVALPIIYLGLRQIFWPERLFRYHNVSATNLTSTLPFVFVIFILVLIFLSIRKILPVQKKISIEIFIAAVCSFFLATWPYVLLGYFPPSFSILPKYVTTFIGRSDWYSRHLTLQPLAAVLVFAGIMQVFVRYNRRLMATILHSLLVLCVFINMFFGFEYFVDYSKQQKVINSLQAENDLYEVHDVQFVDQSRLLNARGRTYRDRDWMGLIWKSYGSSAITNTIIESSCKTVSGTSRLVLIQGPETHWEALKNWVSDGDMGFKVTVDDTPGACKPVMVKDQQSSGAIPILFYFTGAKG